jgi:hypothetical protein
MIMLSGITKIKLELMAYETMFATQQQQHISKSTQQERRQQPEEPSQTLPKQHCNLRIINRLLTVETRNNLRSASVRT